jgi:hypothetical protein
MKRNIKKGLWILLALFTLIGIAFGLNRQIKSAPADPVPTPIDVADDLLLENQKMEYKLRNAPWQGLRYISGQKEWRFYGIAGETKQIDLIDPISLVKVHYLEADGDISFTWVTTEIQFPGKPTVVLAVEPIQAGQLVAIQLKGDYVNQNGVFWEYCDSDYCHLAKKIDTILVLDDQGTGISNGFIRYGWEPPTYPAYGFLCWQVQPAESLQGFLSSSE